MPNLTSRPWTADEILKLKNLAPRYPAVSVAGQLGRSVAATAAKAHELKLSLRTGQTTHDEAAMVVDPGPCGIDLPE
jgi:hypothetical protein